MVVLFKHTDFFYVANILIFSIIASTFCVRLGRPFMFSFGFFFFYGFIFMVTSLICLEFIFVYKVEYWI